MTTEESIRLIKRNMRWQLSDVEVLDEQHCLWIAIATTTYRAPLSEVSFIVLVNYTMYITIDKELLPALVTGLQWLKGK